MTTLAQYERARIALAEATTVTEVMALRDELDHIKLAARKIQNRELIADAMAFQVRIERRLGVLLAAAEEQGKLAPRGRPKAAKDEAEAAARPATLQELNVDRKLAVKARQLAALSEDDVEDLVEATRARVVAGRAKIIDGGAPINGAAAVMGSRAEPDDSLDYFPTPPWATRALMEVALPRIRGCDDVVRRSAWEPACGEGHIAEVLEEYFVEVTATDIHDYGYGQLGDFLDAAAPPAGSIDWIITNPPFRDKAEAFVLRAIALARIGVAMFLRLQWLETEGRYERIFEGYPPTMIAFFAERVPLIKGRWDPDGDTATAYIWLIWVKDRKPQAPFWIQPGQREALTKPDDIARFTTKPVTRRSQAEEAAA